MKGDGMHSQWSYRALVFFVKLIVSNIFWRINVKFHAKSQIEKCLNYGSWYERGQVIFVVVNAQLKVRKCLNMCNCLRWAVISGFALFRVLTGVRQYSITYTDTSTVRCWACSVWYVPEFRPKNDLSRATAVVHTVCRS